MINFFFGWLLRNRKEVYLGDDNSLTLTFNARNEGEGGAYEAELYVVLPPEADYSGIARNNEVKTYNFLQLIYFLGHDYSCFLDDCPLLWFYQCVLLSLRA